MSNSNTMVDISTTFIELNEWNKRLFEKLGWMFLIKSHIGSKNTEYSNFVLYKIKMYKKEVKFLGFALVNKYNKTTEEDRKDDLKILMKQNLILQDAINMLLESISKMNPKVPMSLIDSDMIKQDNIKTLKQYEQLQPSNPDINKMNQVGTNQVKTNQVRTNQYKSNQRSYEQSQPEKVKKNMYEIYKDLQNNEVSNNLFVGGSKKKISIKKKKTSKKKTSKKPSKKPSKKQSKKQSKKTVRKSKK
jgi:hypothetical protein